MSEEKPFERSEFESLEDRPPSEATVREFIAIVTALVKQRPGAAADPDLADDTALFTPTNAKEILVMVFPEENDEGEEEVAGVAEDRIALVRITEMKSEKMREVTEVSALRDGTMSVWKRTDNPELKREEDEDFYRAEVRKDPNARERLNRKRENRRRRLRDAYEVQQILGLDKPTESQIQGINTLLKSFIAS